MNATDPAATGISSATLTLDPTHPVTGDADPGATGAGAHGPRGDAADTLTVDFGFTRAYAVGDFVWIDANGHGWQDASEKPQSGVTVTLLDAAGHPVKNLSGVTVAPVATDAAGHYVFDDLPPGSYTVTFSDLPAGYRLITPSAPGTSSGNDSNPNSAGVTPVFTVGPGQPDTVGVQSDDQVTKASKIDRTIDAGLIPVLALGNYVFVDTNGNGVQDAGDRPEPGVTVTLLDGRGKPAVDAAGRIVGPVKTDGAGHYVFDNLLPGSYQVQFDGVPDGYVFTKSTAAGSTAANDSNPGPTGRTPVFVLTGGGPDVRPVTASDGTSKAGLINPTIDAGIVPVLAVGNAVWFDANHDGIQQPGEKPVAGVTVTLLDAKGQSVTDAGGAVVAPVKTDAEGHYVFDNLLPGKYQISFSDLPPGTRLTTPGAPHSTASNDSNPGTDGLTPVFTLAPGIDTRAVTGTDKVSVAR